MARIASIALTFLFLGFPFYWGTLHHGIGWPIAWAVVLALLVSARRWRHLNSAVVNSIGLTLALSVATCVVVFEIGRVLGH